ncbi:MAG TPA: hypothetical protein VK081_03230 [Planctomycetota bacterium]|nr:hypothetical protein [Planctomycetota bacterium]
MRRTSTIAASPEDHAGARRSPVASTVPRVPGKRLARACLCAAVVLYAVVVFRTAWISDDAYITLRVVENAARGHGLRWNPADRVLVSTHPLWLLLLTALRPLTGEVYFTTLAVAGVLDLAALALLVKLASGPAAAAAGIVVLTMSRAFIDFSTSGLENSLGYALFALLVAFAASDRPRVFGPALVGALLVTTRYDYALLVVPILGAVLWRARSARALLAAGAGMLPFVAWLLFALLYFGSIWPMPAHAKLFATGLPLSGLLQHGLTYLAATARDDTITVAAIAAGLAAALFAPRSLRPLAVGVLLYVGYTVRAGGDFMLGRFFALPAFAAVLALVHGGWLARGRAAAATGAAAVALGLARPCPTLLSGSDYQGQGYIDLGVVDERGFYYGTLGVCSPQRQIPAYGAAAAVLPPDPTGRPQVVVQTAVGTIGFVLGDRAHIVDPLRCDPLVVRLPAVDTVHWRAGHLHRHIPEGYLETLARGENLVRHPGLARYFDALHRVTSGGIFDGERLSTWWRFARGEFDDLLRDYVATDYRKPPPRRVAAADLLPCPEGTPWHDPGVLCLYPGGAILDLGHASRAATLDVALHGQGHYLIEFLREGASLARVGVRTRDRIRAGMSTYEVQVPAEAREAGFDALHVRFDAAASAEAIGAVGAVRLRE